MKILIEMVTNMIIAIVVGFIGAIPGTVVLMWLVGLVHERVLSAVQPAGYADLFLIDWILSYMMVGLVLGIKSALED